MSGLLQRLASQSHGGGLPRLRPMARLPFVQHSEPPAFDIGTERPLAAQTDEPDRMPGSPAHNSPVMAVLVPQKPVAAHPRPASVVPTSDAPSAHTPLVSKPALTPDRKASVPIPPAKHAVQNAADLSAFPLDRSQAWEAAEGPSTENTLAGETLIKRPRQAWPQPLLSADPMASHPASPDAQTNVHVPDLQGAGKAPLSLATRATRETADPNEVHVHIGRIEVTALQAAPVPTRPRRNGAQPLSLQDYLDRKRGKA